ncbi:nucleotidyltransferase domain-containing protein [Pseudoxanthomonas putridarboris]|uniref:Nucleotidyltransferase domain-containing protein n=1 Tax=Pseudoxanthomonas putridarboris TaxID=752605 RepID=A0ABU9J3N3_9GAMM
MTHLLASLNHTVQRPGFGVYEVVRPLMDITDVRQSLSDWAANKPLVARLWIFGSRARGDHRADSDLDIAIQLDLTAANGMDESGGLATWMFDADGWEEELAALLPFTIDL